MIGKSSCSSLASRLAKRSNTSFTHLVVALVRAVDLVDADDGAQPELERLLQHELGLRHRAFGGVHQQDDAVHHVEDALHLAAEVGVAGRVDDVDAGVLPVDRGDLARMVMPRSRSRSLESMARSATFWLSRKAPDCFSSRSTRVVLPWSTWAMMAMLRRFMGREDFLNCVEWAALSTDDPQRQFNPCYPPSC